MNNSFFRVLLLSALTVSCSLEEIAYSDFDKYDGATFYATINEQPDADTKVYADDQLRVLWNADDRITIFNKYTYGYEYYFKGEDGDTAGAFGKVPNDDFVSGNTLDMVYAVYPHSNETKINNDGIITLTLPAEQTYKDSSFGIGANTMVSKTTDNQLRFKNVGVYLSLKFFAEGVSISSITLKGNNGELLAGKCTIDMSSGLPILTMDDGKATDTITLVCDPAVELGNSSSEAIAFWFVLPPVTFSNGITVTVTTSDGGVFEKSTSNKLEIGRSAITKLGALEVVPNYDNVFVEFEDDNFKTYCVENFDTNGDGEISITEASKVTNIDVNKKGITSMRGVECFTALTELHCSDNQLTSLDVSNNTALKWLYCASNQLTNLDFSNNSALFFLFCVWNQLSNLDLSNNTALTMLWCYNNQLTSLDVSKNATLRELVCNNNQLMSLDVSNNTSLTNLDCQNNQLTSLDVSNNTALTYLNCSFNQLTSLDVSNNTALTTLGCENNQLTDLDVNSNTALTQLFCESNQLTSLDVSNNTALTTLGCGNNQFTNLDVSNNTALTSLWCINSPYLTEIWLNIGQTIEDMQYDTDIATIKYKGIENVVPFED